MKDDDNLLKSSLKQCGRWKTVGDGYGKGTKSLFLQNWNHEKIEHIKSNFYKNSALIGNKRFIKGKVN